MMQKIRTNCGKKILLGAKNSDMNKNVVAKTLCYFSKPTKLLKQKIVKHYSIVAEAPAPELRPEAPAPCHGSTAVLVP